MFRHALLIPFLVAALLVAGIVAPAEAKGKKGKGKHKSSKHSQKAPAAPFSSLGAQRLGSTPLLSPAGVEYFNRQQKLDEDRAHRDHLVAQMYAELDAYNYPPKPPAPLTIDRAATVGDVDRIRELINEGAKLDEQDVVGRTPLHWAAVAGQESVAKLLISEGAKLDIPDRMGGMTPLHYAAEHGKSDIVRLLVQHGADLSARDDLGKTPLDLAVENKRDDITIYLRFVDLQNE